jgi:hypothetical protein
MPIPVSLNAVVTELDVQDDESFAYINRETGELVTVSREEMFIAENGEPHDSLPEWQQKMVRIAEEILDSDVYLPLPSKFDIHEYEIMRRFCMSVEYDGLRQILLDAIRGSGAFRRFKDAVHRHGIADEWYNYRQRTFEEIAEDWLKSNNIPYIRP